MRCDHFEGFLLNQKKKRNKFHSLLVVVVSIVVQLLGGSYHFVSKRNAAGINTNITWWPVPQVDAIYCNHPRYTMTDYGYL